MKIYRDQGHYFREKERKKASSLGDTNTNAEGMAAIADG